MQFVRRHFPCDHPNAVPGGPKLEASSCGSFHVLELQEIDRRGQGNGRRVLDLLSPCGVHLRCRQWCEIVSGARCRTSRRSGPFSRREAGFLTILAHSATGGFGCSLYPTLFPAVAWVGILSSSREAFPSHSVLGQLVEVSC